MAWRQTTQHTRVLNLMLCDLAHVYNDRKRLWYVCVCVFLHSTYVQCSLCLVCWCQCWILDYFLSFTQVLDRKDKKWKTIKNSCNIKHAHKFQIERHTHTSTSTCKCKLWRSFKSKEEKMAKVKKRESFNYKYF